MSNAKPVLYPNLEAEIARRGYRRPNIAEAGGFHPSTCTAKLNIPGRLTVKEASAIKDKLFPDLELDYLFQMNPEAGDE